ncbi:PREDICTED: protein boule-like isoform X1 [Acropora digitifera]|uniref:protein boule-like isoform X1 n=1 Tax=Acropora digitifera TaxID=70779 RepID=UPI00077AB1F4|nr:PREDICTED: protein boule-like isoform X1 [Acropora digitifera]
MSAIRGSTATVAVPEGQEIINRVFIGGLARDTSELELENFFSSFGEVVDVRIVCDRKTGLNKGYGFVTFSSMGARDELLKRGTIDYKGGRKLRLRKAVKKEASGQFYPNGETLPTQGGVVANQVVLVPAEPTFAYSNHITVPQYYLPTPTYSYLQQAPATQYYAPAYYY